MTAPPGRSVPPMTADQRKQGFRPHTLVPPAPSSVPLLGQPKRTQPLHPSAEGFLDVPRGCLGVMGARYLLDPYAAQTPELVHSALAALWQNLAAVVGQVIKEQGMDLDKPLTVQLSVLPDPFRGTELRVEARAHRPLLRSDHSPMHPGEIP